MVLTPVAFQEHIVPLALDGFGAGALRHGAMVGVGPGRVGVGVAGPAGGAGAEGVVVGVGGRGMLIDGINFRKSKLIIPAKHPNSFIWDPERHQC